MPYIPSLLNPCAQANGKILFVVLQTLTTQPKPSPQVQNIFLCCYNTTQRALFCNYLKYLHFIVSYDQSCQSLFVFEVCCNSAARHPSHSLLKGSLTVISPWHHNWGRVWSRQTGVISACIGVLIDGCRVCANYCIFKEWGMQNLHYPLSKCI